VFSPCGSMIVSGSGDKTVRIWDISSGRCRCVLTDHSHWVRAVCWSGTGDRVISGSEDGSVLVWDVSRQTCSMIIRGHTEGVTSVSSSRDSSLFASGSLYGSVKIYDARTGDVLQSIVNGGTIHSVKFSTYDNKLLCTNWNSVTIWDSIRKVHVSTIHCGESCAAISPDGTRVASGFDIFVKIWDTRKRTFEFRNSIESSPHRGYHFCDRWTGYGISILLRYQDLGYNSRRTYIHIRFSSPPPINRVLARLVWHLYLSRVGVITPTLKHKYGTQIPVIWFKSCVSTSNWPSVISHCPHAVVDWFLNRFQISHCWI
jgi:WD40 repeat protein